MTLKINYIESFLEDAKLREALAEVVADVDALIPQSEEEFMELQKFGLYPAEECVPFVTKQDTPFYQLDNMAMVPKGETSCYLHYGDFEFRQLEVLYIMARTDSASGGTTLLRCTHKRDKMTGEHTVSFRATSPCTW